MALKTFLFVVTNCLFLNSVHSFPQPISDIPFSDFVLDGKKDCGLVNHNQNVIELFKINSCPKEAIKFSSDYFDQRDVLPCFGCYDALYNLCKFPLEKINVTRPTFKDSNKFCTEAKTIYDHISFNYTDDDVKNWGEALVSAMTNETVCNNLCVLNDIINDECIAMTTFAHEYLRLNGTDLNAKIPTSVNTQPKEQNSTTTLGSKVSENTTSSAKTNKVGGITNARSGDTLVLDKDAEISKGTETLNTNSKVDSKAALPESKSTQTESKPANFNPSIVVHNNEGDAEIKTPIKESKAQKSDQNVDTSPVIGTSTTSKIPPSAGEETVIDDSEKTIPDIEEIRAGNEEPINPIETKEKGEHYEENDRPPMENEVDKQTVPDTEQPPAAFHGGMSPSFNGMSDNFSESEDSYSFTYIVTTMAALCCVYLLFHYRNKLLALALEGRKGRSSRGRGRPSSANYSKLHSNLEEAIASNVTTPSATHVLY